MSDQLIDVIPTPDLSDFMNGDENAKSLFVKSLGEEYESIGFVAVKNHKYFDVNQVKS